MSTQLRTLRQAAGLTQSALAIKARVHQATIGRLESGSVANPFHHHVQRICAALGVSWSDVAEFRVPGVSR